jgi:predicted DNA-binding transcriptional regulator AlpA
LPESERLKATDLRTALLLGRVPDDTGLLIDVHMVAKLLSVSARTVARLQELKAIPHSVKLGTLVRWKLIEIIEWLDCGCPSRWQMPSQGKKGGRI